MGVTLVLRSCILWTLMGFVDPLESPSGVSSIMRHYQGDLYIAKETDVPSKECACGLGSLRVGPPKECQCQCAKELPTFRDDTLECVKDIHECHLAEFVSSFHTEKIPYVYIPNSGQLVHPTAEIALLDLDSGSHYISPVCVIRKTELLTSLGWKDFNDSSFQGPFRLFPDSGKTYLQWTGEMEEKNRSQGRVLLIHLFCRDEAKPQRNIFQPCLAFRIAGSSILMDSTRLRETSEVVPRKEIMNTNEVVAVTVALGCLAVAFMSLCALYWKMKRSKKNVSLQHRKISENSENFKKSCMKIKSSEQVPAKKIIAKRTSLVSSEEDSECEDLEDLSKKPTLKNKVTFTTVVVHDENIYSIPSEEEEKEGERQRLERLKMEMNSKIDDEEGRPGKALSYLPVTDKTCDGGNSKVLTSSGLKSEGELAKQKLYFNPAYFDPENLQSPPPGAVEFLSKIREMISTAKTKMQNKTFQPSLIDIPEDDYSLRASRTPSTLSNTRTVSRATYRADEVEGQEINKETEEPIYNDISEVVADITPSGENSKGNSTLKRLAQRVNTHGQTLVSEIIKTLDLKPRFPDSFYRSYPTATYRSTSNCTPCIKEAVKGKKSNELNKNTYFPELVKPSMLRNALTNDLNKGHTINAFESFRQEILATINKVKSVSPISSLGSNKSRNSSKSPETPPELPPEPPESKVHKWLQSLDIKNNYYSKMNDSLTKGEAKLTRSSSLCHSKECGSLPSMIDSLEYALNQEDASLTHFQNQNIYVRSVSPVKRALSFQNEYSNCDPQNIPPRSLPPATDESKNYTDSDKSVSEYINHSMFKHRKLEVNDTESEISDYNTRYIDSLEYNNIKNENFPPIPPLITSGSKENAAIVEEMNVITHGTGLYGNPFLAPPENSYEEIQFKTISSASRKSTTSTLLKETQGVAEGESIRNSKKEGTFSNSESLVSEIHISGEKPIKMQTSDNRLSIEVNDENEVENLHFQSSKTRNKVKRNDSILQDSLERPKHKKHLISTSCCSDKENNGIPNKETDGADRSKTLRTFKDYHFMKFARKEGNDNQLSIFGEGINFNYRSASPSGSSSSKPPLPPKQVKASEDTVTETLSVPKVPPRCNLRYSLSMSADVLEKYISKPSSEDEAPKLPPKMKHRQSFSRNGQEIVCQNQNENNPKPPKLPEKLRRKDSNPITLSPPVNFESGDLEQNFPKSGKIINDENISINNEDGLPTKANSQYHGIHSLMGIDTNYNIGEQMDKEKSTSMSDWKQMCLTTSGGQGPDSKNGPKHEVHQSVNDIVPIKLREEIEQHFKEKGHSDIIKRKCRKPVEIVNPKDVNKYLLYLHSKTMDFNSKNEDSGYHSTDSSDSYNMLNSTNQQNSFHLQRRGSTAAHLSSLNKSNSEVGSLCRSGSLKTITPAVLEERISSRLSRLNINANILGIA